ncbi:MAG: hypothetical protein HUU21_29320 [Polyangiaceae bacterium]|nr:hypothetical protein [Polyangiaceae bacterium]
MPVERAARVTSPVEHSSMLLRNEAYPKIAVLFTVSVATGQVEGVEAASWLVDLAKFGDEYLLPAEVSEWIVEGVDHVFLQKPRFRAANVSEKTITSKDHSSPATGSDSVYIENRPASRRFDFTLCGGKIVDGAEDIYYGGTPASKEERPPEGPGWMQSIEKIVKTSAMLGTRPKGILGWLTRGLEVADFFKKLPETPVKDGVLLGLGNPFH